MCTACGYCLKYIRISRGKKYSLLGVAIVYTLLFPHKHPLYVFYPHTKNTTHREIHNGVNFREAKIPIL